MWTFNNPNNFNFTLGSERAESMSAEHVTPPDHCDQSVTVGNMGPSLMV